MNLEKRITLKELLEKKPDKSWIPVYKITGVYYNEKPIYEVKNK